jgi:glycine/D-amino acid oxidase-like deaminating enzyme
MVKLMVIGTPDGVVSVQFSIVCSASGEGGGRYAPDRAGPRCESPFRGDPASTAGLHGEEEIDMSQRSFVVVGGGVLGVTTARRLATTGTRVTLLTDGSLADGASGRSLAWLNSAAIRDPEYHALRIGGIARYRALLAEEGTAADRWLVFGGGLTWHAPGREGELQAVHDHQSSVGYPVRRIGRDEVARLVPGVEPGAVPDAGALFNPDEGWVDLPSLVDLLARQVVAAGGEVRTGCGPVRVDVRDGRAVGAVTSDGSRVPADGVLLATGAAVPDMLAGLGVHLPEQTPLAVLVRTEPVASPLRAVLNVPGVSLRPAPDGGLAVDADWATDHVRATESGYQVAEDVVEDLLSRASAVLSGRPALSARRVHIGRKPVPGDGRPVLGELAGVPGLSVAFTHSGATLALIVGDLLADEMRTGDRSGLLASFRPERFS